MINDEWLYTLEDNSKIVLSPRTLVELKEYFKTTDEDGVEHYALEPCMVCQNFVAHDVSPPELQCAVANLTLLCRDARVMVAKSEFTSSALRGCGPMQPTVRSSAWSAASRWIRLLDCAHRGKRLLKVPNKVVRRRLSFPMLMIDCVMACARGPAFHRQQKFWRRDTTFPAPCVWQEKEFCRWTTHTGRC